MSSFVNAPHADSIGLHWNPFPEPAFCLDMKSCHESSVDEFSLLQLSRLPDFEELSDSNHGSV